MLIVQNVVLQLVLVYQDVLVIPEVGLRVALPCLQRIYLILHLIHLLIELLLLLHSFLVVLEELPGDSFLVNIRIY